MTNVIRSHHMLPVCVCVHNRKVKILTGSRDQEHEPWDPGASHVCMVTSGRLLKTETWTTRLDGMAGKLCDRGMTQELADMIVFVLPIGTCRRRLSLTHTTLHQHAGILNQS